MEYSTNSILSLISHLHTVSADFTNRRLADTAGLVSSHGYILYLLSQHQKLSMKELADGINRDKSTTTVLIRKLRESGLVREEAAEDGAGACLHGAHVRHIAGAAHRMLPRLFGGRQTDPAGAAAAYEPEYRKRSVGIALLPFFPGELLVLTVLMHERFLRLAPQ